MAEASLIFRILMVLILVAFVIVFIILSFHDRKDRASSWIANAYALGILAFLFDLSRSNFNPVFFDLLAKLSFWSVSIAWTMGICAHFRARAPLKSMILISLIGLVSLSWFSFVQPDIILRSVGSTITAGLLLTCSLPTLWQHRSNAAEQMLMFLIAVFGASHFARPIIAYLIFSDFHTDHNYDSSVYAALLHSVSAVLALACGISMALVVGLKIIERHFLASIRDPLTGLLNRRGLEQHVSTLKPADYQSGRSLLIVDLDHFKSVNDRFGHDVGDEILKRSADLLKTLTTGLGEIARIGGEEFLIILNPMDEEDRHSVAQHLRVSIGMIKHPELPERETVTASMGLASLSVSESFSMTVRKADQCLYEAKARGRNRVVLAANSPAQPQALPQLQLVEKA